ncbi:MAG: hypothetical protein ACXAC8_13770 [Candidatus Hodarchaeales archaeon]|jgi:chromosome segregation ATPase
MTSSESQKLREYGLEFINDLAKDRKVGVQSLGVAFSTYKTGLRNSHIVTRIDDRELVNELLKDFRQEITRNFESQLTRITIKSLGWMKQVLRRDEKIIIKEEHLDEEQIQELQQTIKALTQDLKVQKIEQAHQKQSMEEQLTAQEKRVQEVQGTLDQTVSEFQQRLLTEKTQVQTLTAQIKNFQEQLTTTQTQLAEKEKQFLEVNEENSQLNLELVDKNGEIDRLKKSLEETQTLTDQDTEDAMQTWMASYQDQEKYFQESLAQVKSEYETAMKTKLESTTIQFQEENNQLKNNLQEIQEKQKTQEKKYLSKISELTLNNESLQERKIQIESQLLELVQQNEKLQTQITDQEAQYQQLKREMEEKIQETTLHLRNIQIAKIRSKAEWLEQCLSYSNFAPLTILYRMNGKMSLDSLAKSVGMDTLVLQNQLNALHQRDLIDFRHDGTVVANIPSQD